MRARLALLGLIVWGATGCGNQTQASPRTTPSQSPSHSHSHSPAPTPSTSPGGGPPAPTVTVSSVGGASGPTGLLGVAVVTDVSAEAAGSVTVNFTAQVGGGGRPVTASGHLVQLRPAETQAVTASLTIPAGVAVTHLTATAEATGAATQPAPPLSVGAPTFQSSGYATSVAIVAVNAGAVPLPAEIVVVCSDARRTIMGGGALGPQTMPPGTTPLTVAVSVTDVPAACQGYIHLA